MEKRNEFRAIIRIAGKDCDGSRRVDHALRVINGVGIALARAVVKAAGIPLNTRLGNLTEDEVARLERILREPSASAVPAWMLNRQRDPETGQTAHLIGPDLTVRVRMDVEKMKRIRSWRGVRHSLGLRVRGQHTKTTGRTGRTMGVSKKKALEAQRQQLREGGGRGGRS